MSNPYKSEPVDLMKLYVMSDSSEWKEFLQGCYDNKDITALLKMRYGVQAGMAKVAKQKLNTHAFDVWYVRLIKSIDDTVKKIIRFKNPNPCDNPMTAVDNIEFQPEKRERDHDLEKNLKKYGY